MGRVYTVSSSASVSAVQDLIAIYTGARAVRLHGFTIGQTSSATVGNLAISVKRIGGTLSNGSGGTAPTPVPVQPNDTAATVTARANDTTQASGTTTVVLLRDAYNPINGYLHLPPEDDRFVASPNEILVISLDGAPSPSQTTLTTADVEELF
jgi:hypothetical protein